MILVQAFARGAVVIAVAAIISVLLRNRSAAVRHHVWATAVAVQLALLVFVPVMPTLSLPIVPTIHMSLADMPMMAATGATNNGPDDRSGNTTARAEDGTAAVPGPTDAVKRTPAEPRLDWRTVLLYIWMTGAALIFLRYLIGTIMMMRIARSGRRIDDGDWLSLAQRTATSMEITRPLTMLWGDKLGIPITWGVLYPVILLPEEAHTWPLERRRFVLVHEMAHVKRFDAVTQLFAQLTLAAFWFSPLVWLAEWRMRVEREHACDDAVIQHGTEPSLYADELLQMVRSLVQRRTTAPAFAALAMARKSEFEGRMLAILDPERRRTVSGLWSGAMFALLSLVIAAPVAAIDPFAFKVVAANDAAKGALSAPPPTKPAEVAGPAWGECSLTTSSTSTHVHEDTDAPDKTRIRIEMARPGRCLYGEINGNIEFGPNEASVREIGQGGLVRLREVTNKVDYSMTMTRGSNGEVKGEYVVDGTPARAEMKVDKWLARVLPEVLREAGVGASARVSRSLSGGGLEGALGDISAIQSDAAQAAHFQALIGARKWTDTQAATIEKAVVEQLNTSPNDAARLLQLLPGRQKQTGQQGSTSKVEMLEKVYGEMSSESELRTILTAQLPNANRDMLLMMARVASRMGSGHEAGSFLMAAAPHYLAKKEKALEDGYFHACESMGSSYERMNVLLTALKYARGNERVTKGIIKAASSMSSDTDKATVLMAVAAQKN